MKRYIKRTKGPSSNAASSHLPLPRIFAARSPWISSFLAPGNFCRIFKVWSVLRFASGTFFNGILYFSPRSQPICQCILWILVAFDGAMFPHLSHEQLRKSSTPVGCLRSSCHVDVNTAFTPGTLEASGCCRCGLD